MGKKYVHTYKRTDKNMQVEKRKQKILEYRKKLQTDN